MKRILLCPLFLLLFGLSAVAVDPVAQITFRVTDDFGSAVAGAPVTVSTFSRWVPGEEFGHDEDDQVTGDTDTNGLAVLRLRSMTGNIRYSVSGVFDRANKMEFGDMVYYLDRGELRRFTNQVAGRWQPWNAIVDVMIKPVLNPIPMFAMKYGGSYQDRQRQSIPEYDKAVGFDLMKGDWIAPYGEGETADFIFTLACKLGGQTSSKYQIFDAALDIRFSNEGDGIQPVYVNPLHGSTLRLPRIAPEVGYTTNWTKVTFKHEGGGLHEKREDQNYVFRVRTKIDDSGKIVSALYGKIHGEIDYSWNGRIKFIYYLNPTPNDRNMEFDPSKNLFTNLSPSEQVREP